MSQIKDNGDGTVTVSKELLQQLYKEHVQVKADVELRVDTIAKMLIVLGIITKDGDIKENYRFRDLVKTLTSLVSDSVFNSAGLEKKFGFVKDPKCLAVVPNTVTCIKKQYQNNCHLLPT